MNVRAHSSSTGGRIRGRASVHNVMCRAADRQEAFGDLSLYNSRGYPYKAMDVEKATQSGPQAKRANHIGRCEIARFAYALNSPCFVRRISLTSHALLF